MTAWRASVVACGLLLALVPGLRAEDRYFDSGGVKIRYVVQGKGEPVLLIHGFGANVEAQWILPGVFGNLARDYRVIAFDNRGHGRSGRPHDPKQYGTEMVEDCVRLLDHLHIKKAHVVGYSMGALIAARLLVTHPDRLLSVTLGGAGAARKEAWQEGLAEKLLRSLDAGKGITPLIEALTPPGRPKPSAEQMRVINLVFTAFNDQKALAAAVRGWKELVVTDAELKANRVPVLAVVGALDPAKKGVDELDGRLRGLRVVVVPGGDHMDAFTRPAFLRAVRAFLSEHPARSVQSAP